MNRVLISGGTGFVGYWLQQTQPAHMRGTYLSHVVYDAMNWKKMSFDYIIHAAPISPVHALEMALYYGIRMLYVSSGVVYHPEYQDAEYRQDKLDGEKECLDSGADVCIARLFTFYGDRLDDHKAYTNFVKAATSNKPLIVWGDGSTIRSYMHGQDMARRLWAILEDGEKGQAYDVGAMEPITTLELAQEVKATYRSVSEIVMDAEKFVPMPVYLPEDVTNTEQLYETWKERNTAK